MNKLSLENRQNRWNEEYYYDDVEIDDLFIEQWVSQFVTEIPFGIETRSLTRAFSLRDDSETEIVWLYLGQLAENDKYFVPILTCSDDVDLDCSVIVTEQFTQDNRVNWLRFGLLQGDFLEQNPNEIQWFDDVPSLTFEKQNFITVFNQLLESLKKDYLQYGKVLKIKFPSDPPKPPKEDWELIIDSWYD